MLFLKRLQELPCGETEGWGTVGGTLTMDQDMSGPGPALVASAVPARLVARVCRPTPFCSNEDTLPLPCWGVKSTLSRNTTPKQY